MSEALRCVRSEEECAEFVLVYGVAYECVSVLLLVYAVSSDEASEVLFYCGV